jgi:quercetin dioxygenase-like cupin family protein
MEPGQRQKWGKETMSALRIIRAGARPTTRAPAANFTGTVFSDEVVVGVAPSRMRASVVSFTPGARTAWHSHPVGQTLYCLSGAGRVQREGEPVQELRPGDVVLIPPDVRHWHGAAPDRLFSHLAMSELNDKGEGTAWFEHVSDADYEAKPAPVR